MKEQISIKVNIADRVYPLKVNMEEEENIRKAADLINKKVSMYVDQYAIKDKQAAISMCALEIMTEFLNLDEENRNNSFEIESKLIAIESLLADI